MSRVTQRLAPLGLAALFALGGWTAARAARLALPEGRPTRAPAAREGVDLKPLYDSATTAFTGTLAPAAGGALAARPGGAGPALVVLLRRGDIAKCEDLGRQLRELRRAARGRAPLVVWAGPGDTAAIRAFLRREKLGDTHLAGVDPGRAFARGGTAATPAVLLAGGGETVRGVAHPRQFPNLRLRSFATEMEAMLARPGQGGGSDRPGEEGTDSGSLPGEKERRR